MALGRTRGRYRDTSEDQSTVDRLREALDLPARRALEATMLLDLPRDVVLGTGLVIDAGAHVGDWTSGAAVALPNARIVAFEPSPSTYEELRANVGHEPRVETINLGLSSSSETRTLNVFNHRGFDSLHAPVQAMNDLYGSAPEVVRTESVELRRLDDVLADRYPGMPVLGMKIDVQGFEPQVLGGATDALSGASFLVVELLFAPHYEADANWLTLSSMIADLGFVPSSIRNLNRSESGRLLFADMLFIRPAAT